MPLRLTSGGRSGDALKVGWQNDGAGDLWLAVAKTKWGTIPGKAKDQTCWYSYGGKEHYTSSFQWVASSSGSSRVRNTGSGPPAAAQHLGYQNDGAGQLYGAVASSRWGDIPGKAKGNTCWFAYGGKEHYTSNFHWIISNKGSSSRRTRRSTNTDWGSKFQIGCVQPYKKGIEYFDVFASALTTYSENDDQNQFKAAKVNLSRMNDNFKATKTTSFKMRDELANEMSSLLSEQKAKKNEQNRIDQKLNNLRIRISGANERLTKRRNDLDYANTRLANAQRKEREAQRTLNAAKKRQSDMKAAAIGVSFIPIFGWIAGPTLAIISVTAEENSVQSARGKLGSRTSERRDRQRNMDSAAAEVNSLQNQLQSNYREKQHAAEQVALIKKDLSGIQKEKDTVSNFQGNINLTSTYFATVFTRSQKAQASKDKDVERLMMTLKDTANALSAGNISVNIDPNRIRKIAKALNEIQFNQPEKLDDLLDEFGF